MISIEVTYDETDGSLDVAGDNGETEAEVFHASGCTKDSVTDAVRLVLSKLVSTKGQTITVGL